MATKQQFSYPSSATVTVSAIGPNGAPIPTTSILVAGEDPSLNLHPLQTDSSGNLSVNIAGSTGALTANQGTPNTIANAWPVKLTDGTNTNSFTGSSLNVAVSASALPTGAATAALQTTGNTSLASIDTKTPALGQALAAASVPVVLTAAQLSTLTPLTSVTVTQTTGTNLHAVIDNFPATQPVSGTVAATQSGTWNITNVSGTVSLPTGAATSALQTALNAQIPTTLGQKTSANSLAVVLASDQSSIIVSQGAFTASNAPVQNVYSSTNITTSAYTQLIASTTSATKWIDIFDSSGQAMILATGAAASEVIQAYIPPGGDSFSFAIPAGTRVAYKALSANATAGYLLLNLRG